VGSREAALNLRESRSFRTNPSDLKSAAQKPRAAIYRTRLIGPQKRLHLDAAHLLAQLSSTYSV